VSADVITIGCRVSRKYPRRRRYRADLSDSTWAGIAAVIVPDYRHAGGPPERGREYLDATLNLL
jgi:hypothetical protein